MKIMIAMLATETNSFAPLPTGLSNFHETCYFDGDATRQPRHAFTAAMHLWRQRFEREGIETVESISTFAQPGGITSRITYETLRDKLLSDIRQALPLDGVALFLHGSMVADGYEDCEGDILRRVRGLVGDACKIGVELDLHATLTPDMVGHSDLILSFKLYPHTDIADRAAELAELMIRTLHGRIRPRMAICETGMISLWRTSDEPMAGFVRDMQAAEASGEALSVSFIHGFPWTDVPFSSAKMLVICDDDDQAAEAVARKFARRIVALRDQTGPRQFDMDPGIDHALSLPEGPVVLVDTGDNAGAGASSDSTFLLRRLLDREIGNVATGLYWDPIAVRICMDAGEGAILRLRVGGKCGPESGDPLDLCVEVRRILPAASQTFVDAPAPMGDSVWIRTGDEVDVILTSIRCQTLHPDAFEQFGIDLRRKRLVCVKSLQHFYDGFVRLTPHIVYLSVPGALDMNFARIPYTRRDGDYWPRVEQPSAMADILL
ncbi:hypothetical protein IT41_15545 [Paracoccus halophilus]|nr:M81 family metallopeptidase [Paracoccus halophilus]KGJ03026.1 hypothetical protein IT41_15545 [Paracoccus halophilus]